MHWCGRWLLKEPMGSGSTFFFSLWQKLIVLIMRWVASVSVPTAQWLDVFLHFLLL